MIRFYDLFGGCGGFRVGLETANRICLKYGEVNAEQSREDGQYLSEQRGSGASSIREGIVPNGEARETRGDGGSASSSPIPECVQRSEQQGNADLPHLKSGANSESRVQESTGEFRCVGYCDLDKTACAVYNARFGEQHQPTDATAINTSELPDFDLICAGFPCQSFSMAGKRQGFNDTRGTLFFEVARIAKAKRPRLLLLENVPGILTLDKGETFRTILNALEELGYWFEWSCVNSRHFVPQNRERVFIVGHLASSERSAYQVFPFTESDFLPLEEKPRKPKSGIGTQIASCLDANYGKGGLDRQQVGYEIIDPYNANVISDDKATSLRTNWQNGNAWVALTEARTEGAKEIRRENMANGRDYAPRADKELVPREDDLANTITAGQSKEHLLFSPCITTALGRQGSSSEYIESIISVGQASGIIRRLTPVECERLQAYPDDWSATGDYANGKGLVKIADTGRYKLMGNSVTTSVIAAIGRKILKCERETNA